MIGLWSYSQQVIRIIIIIIILLLLKRKSHMAFLFPVSFTGIAKVYLRHAHPREHERCSIRHQPYCGAGRELQAETTAELAAHSRLAVGRDVRCLMIEMKKGLGGAGRRSRANGVMA